MNEKENQCHNEITELLRQNETLNRCYNIIQPHILVIPCPLVEVGMCLTALGYDKHFVDDMMKRIVNNPVNAEWSINVGYLVDYVCVLYKKKCSETVYISHFKMEHGSFLSHVYHDIASAWSVVSSFRQQLNAGIDAVTEEWKGLAKLLGKLSDLLTYADNDYDEMVFSLNQFKKPDFEWNGKAKVSLVVAMMLLRIYSFNQLNK